MKMKDVEKYLALYGTEDYLFKVLGPRIKKRGYATFDEFYRICMWKSVRPKQKYIRNKDTVEGITKEAFAEKDESQRLEDLLRLRGVGIPTASAPTLISTTTNVFIHPSTMSHHQ